MDMASKQQQQKRIVEGGFKYYTRAAKRRRKTLVPHEVETAQVYYPALGLKKKKKSIHALVVGAVPDNPIS